MFDYTYDFALGPAADETQRKAAVTQLFFATNFFHDWYYDVGFDEAAGNAQASNLGRGGVEGDPLLAEAQDSSAENNASMYTPADGASPRMQMHIFTGDDNAFVTTTPAVSNGGVGVRGRATFGPQSFRVTGQLILVNDQDTTPNDGCGAGTWLGDYAGKIAVVDRGTCSFVEKVERAQALGAVGVLIANNQGGFSFELSGTPTVAITIPTLGISRNSGTALKSALAGSTLNGTMNRELTSPRDGTLDTGVVAHEWGHYVSNRLIGNANGLAGQQAGGMGEGWSDFHAALMIVREGDDQLPSNANWTGAYSLSGWAAFVTDTNAYYWGLRRYPLSIDMGKNPLTFRHIAAGQALPTGVPTAFTTANQGVHATGEVWAVMLWEVYVELLKAHPFAEAQERMKRYLVGGYKATPNIPTFVDARDALLAAIAASDPADYARAWTAFARRGLGIRAVAPPVDSTSNSPLTESFEVGNEVSITQVALDDSGESCDADGTLDAEETGVLRVTVRNIGVGALNDGTVSVNSSEEGLSFPDGASKALPALEPYASVTLEFPVALALVKGVRLTTIGVEVAQASLLNGGKATGQSIFRLNADVARGYTSLDDVEAPSEWTTSENAAPGLVTGGAWRVAKDEAGNHFWLGPTSSAPADVRLTSPVLSVGGDPLILFFKHRHDFEADPSGEYFDGAVIEVSKAGEDDWQPVAAPGYGGELYAGRAFGSQFFPSSNPLAGRLAYVGQSLDHPAFVEEAINLGTTFANSDIQIRFRVGSDDAAAVGSWDLDDIGVEGLVMHPFSAVVADANRCRPNTAPVVLLPPELKVRPGEAVQLTATVTDAEGDALTPVWAVEGAQVTTTGEGLQLGFTAPATQQPLTLTVRLTVTDERGLSAQGVTRVVVTPEGGCGGCSSGFELAPLLGLALALRGRRRRTT